jgi:hypothetical protein
MGIVAEGANDLKVIVVDNVGNSTTFESRFLEVKIIKSYESETTYTTSLFFLFYFNNNGTNSTDKGCCAE